MNLIKLSRNVVTAMLTGIAFTGIASAQMIGVDFNLGGAADQSPGPAAVVGPYASAGWYNTVNVGSVPGPLTGLIDSNNTATTAAFSFTQGGNALNGNPIYNSNYGAAGSADAGLTANQQLFNGAAASSGGGFDQELKITDIPYATFDLYLLIKAPVGNQGYGDAGYYGETSIQIFNGVTGGTTFFLASRQSNPIPSGGFSFIQGTSTDLASPTMEANYVLFSGLTGGLGSSYSFDLHSPSGNGDPFFFNGYGLVSGLQIVAAVPEPSTYALMLTGLGILFVMGRRNRRPGRSEQ